METKGPKSIAKVTIRANIYYYYIMILFKQFYLLSCCHLTFRKIWYCLIKTHIDLVSLSFSNEIYQKNHVHFNVIKQLQSCIGRCKFLWTLEINIHLSLMAQVNIDIKVHNIVLLLDVFHIGLVIGPWLAVLAWGTAERQYSRPRTYN